MSYGNISKRVTIIDKGKTFKFDSKLEHETYKILRRFYEPDEILKNTKKTLVDEPKKISTFIDFETPRHYIECKGSWAFANKNDIAYIKLKYVLFIKHYRDKPFILLVDNLTKKISTQLPTELRLTSKNKLFNILTHDLPQ